MATPKAAYDESNIERFAGLAGIRKKPTVYVGPMDHSGLWTIFREPADNGVDQALAGRNSLVHLVIDEAPNTYWVLDEGEGIPVGLKVFEDERGKKEKLSTLFVVTGLTHGGGNFSGDTISRGTHGIGIKATNALSSSFIVWTFREGQWWCISYASGKIVKDVHKTTAPKLPHGLKRTSGTVVKFVPELDLFAKGSKIKITDVRDWCRLTSYLVAGLKVQFTTSAGKTQTFVSKRGSADFIDHRVEELKCTVNGKPFLFSSKECDVAVAFSDAEGTDNVYAYTNGLRNSEGGEHLRALHDALTKSLLPYKGKLEYTPTDLKEGLLGLVNYKISAPQFNNQTKDKLLDGRVYDVAVAQMLEALTDFWNKNKTLAKELVKRASELRKRTSDFLKDKKLIKNVKGAIRGLSAKLADVNGKTPFIDRELYLVEGDSAGGCMLGHTTVSLINGEKKTFKQLVSDHERGITNYGYAHSNKTGRIHVVPFVEPRIVKYTRFLTEVTLDNGGKVCCTRDHPWKLRTGEYLGAEELVVGDSLMPFRERIREHGADGKVGRREVYHPMWSASGNPTKLGKWGFVYQLVGDSIPALKQAKQALHQKMVISHYHHMDFDRLNDHPSNLEVLPQGVHLDLHGELTRFETGDKNVHSVAMREDKVYRRRFVKAAEKHFQAYWSKSENRAAQSERTTKAMSGEKGAELRSRISDSAKEYWTPARKQEQSKLVTATSHLYKHKVRNTIANNQWHSYMGQMLRLKDVGNEYAFNVAAAGKGLIKDFEFWTLYYKSYKTFVRALSKYKPSQEAPEQIAKELRVGRDKAKYKAGRSHWQKFMLFAQQLSVLDEKHFSKATDKYVKSEGKRLPFSFKYFAEYYKSEKAFVSAVKAFDEYTPMPKVLIKNHEVVRVRNIELKHEVPVYDATVEHKGLHNYALGCGVFVHNTAKVARHRSFQATFSLKGKPLNVMEATKDRVNSNKEIAGIFAGIGLDLGAADPISKIRFGKIIFLADPDVDGCHINTLLMTLFWKYLPDLYKEGRIYMLISPEYMAKHKGKVYFSSSVERVYKKCGTDKVDIRHIKGWGELDAVDMQPIAFDVGTRKLARILPPKGKDGILQFEALMGKKSLFRQQLLGVVTGGVEVPDTEES